VPSFGQVPDPVPVPVAALALRSFLVYAVIMQSKTTYIFLNERIFLFCHVDCVCERLVEYSKVINSFIGWEYV